MVNKKLNLRKVIAIAICLVSFSSSAIFAQVTQSSSLLQTVRTSPEKAEEIAIKRVGGGTVVEIDLERKNQIFRYEVEIKHEGRKYEIKIDAITGEIIKFKDSIHKKTSAQSHTGSLTQSVKITFAQAEEIALKRANGGTVMEVKLGSNYQQITYEVEVRHEGRKFEIKIDAKTGEILKYKVK
jgi:uncharacterized membrane protein YkoI